MVFILELIKLDSFIIAWFDYLLQFSGLPLLWEAGVNILESKKKFLMDLNLKNI